MSVIHKKKQKAPSCDEKVFTAEPKIKYQKSEIVAPPTLIEL